jgi:hypothetical protein
MIYIYMMEKIEHFILTLFNFVMLYDMVSIVPGWICSVLLILFNLNEIYKIRKNEMPGEAVHVVYYCIQ